MHLSGAFSYIWPESLGLWIGSVIDMEETLETRGTIGFPKITACPREISNFLEFRVTASDL